MRIALLAVLLSGLIFMGGCLHFEYEGIHFQACTKPSVYESTKSLPEKDYIFMGNCVAYGKYNEFTREEIYKRLIKEAEQRGADAILIDAYQIIPTNLAEKGIIRQDSINVWSEGSYTNSGWNQLYRDFDQYYGSIGKNAKKGVALSYTRVVRASFLKFDKNLPPSFDRETYQQKLEHKKEAIEEISRPTVPERFDDEPANSVSVYGSQN